MYDIRDPNSNMPANWGQFPDPHGDSFGNMRRSLSEILRVLTVRKWVFLIPFCVATSAAFVLSLYVPRRYVAKTVFERRDDPVLVNLPRSEGTGAFAAFRRTLANDVADVQSLTEMIESRGLLEKLQASSKGAAADVDARQWAERISSGIEVALLHQSPNLDMIELKLAMDDPSDARMLLNEVRDHYIQSTQQRITTHLSETRDYFEKECDQRQGVVEQLQDDLLAFQKEHHGLNPLNPAINFAQLDNLRTDRTMLKRRQREMETRLETRRDALPAITVAQPVPGVEANMGFELEVETPVRSAESMKLATELQGVWDQIDELKTQRGMTDRHPEIQSLRSKADAVLAAIDQQNIEDQKRMAANRVLQIPMMPVKVVADTTKPSAFVEVEILEKLVADNLEEIAAVEFRIAELENMQQEAFNRRKEFSTRQAHVERAKYDLTLFRSYADQINRVLEADESRRGILFEKVKPAKCSFIPMSPRLTTVVLLALVTGGGLGTVMVLLSELFDRTIRTRDQVMEGLGLPILESIDLITTIAARRKMMFKKYMLVPALSVVLLVVVGGSGSIAYLSLHDKAAYERAIALPRSIVKKVSEAVNTPTIAQANTGTHREVTN